MERYVMRWLLSHASCFFAVFVGGQAWLILLYRGYLARHFALSDSEVRVVISASIIGGSFSLPIAYLNDQIGPRWCMVTSVTLNSLGLISIWLATSLDVDYQPNYIVLAFCFFTASMGSAMSLLTGISTALYNTTRRHRAMICAVLGLVYEASTQLVQMLRRGFHGSESNANDKEDAVMPRLTLALLGMTILGGIISISGIKIFPESRHFEASDDKNLLCAVDLCTTSKKVDGPDLCSTNVLQWKSQISVWKVLATFEFQCIIWSSGLFLALAQFNRLSLPAMTSTASASNNFTVSLTSVYSVAAILTRFPLACLVDTYNEKLFVYLVLLCVKLLGMLGHFLMFLEWTDQVLVTFYVISGITDGVCLFEIIVLTCQMFGYERMARNISIPLLAKSLFIVSLEYIDSSLSSHIVKSADDTFCYGQKCKFPTSLVCTVLSVTGILVFIPLIFLRSNSFQCTKFHPSCKELIE